MTGITGGSPNAVTGEGNDAHWNTDPGSFNPGEITHIAQKLSADPGQGDWSDPIPIDSNEFIGPQGYRGAVDIAVPVNGWDGVWSNIIASQYVSGGSPQEWDIVTLYQTEDETIEETRRYNATSTGWEWELYN